MSKNPVTCACWDITSPDVRFCEEHHKYAIGKKELVSVSKLIASVYSRKTWDGVDPRVIESARERGQAVDAYVSDYLTTGSVSVMAGEREDVIQRLDHVIRWIDKNLPSNMPAVVHKIVYSATDGVAGTFDFRVDDTIYELKVVSELQPSYKIQLGAYAQYSDGVRNVAILHVTKKECKRVEFDREQCVGLFLGALVWYEQIREMEA